MWFTDFRDAAFKTPEIEFAGVTGFLHSKPSKTLAICVVKHDEILCSVINLNFN